MDHYKSMGNIRDTKINAPQAKFKFDESLIVPIHAKYQEQAKYYQFIMNTRQETLSAAGEIDRSF